MAVNNSSNHKILKPNLKLSDLKQLYTMSESPVSNSVNLTSSNVFKTSQDINGSYICRASNMYGTSNTVVHLIVNGQQQLLI